MPSSGSRSIRYKSNRSTWSSSRSAAASRSRPWCSRRSSDTRALDCLAGDRALERVVHLVLGVNRQFEVEPPRDVDVGEDALLVVLDHALVLHRVAEVFVLEQAG